MLRELHKSVFRDLALHSSTADKKYLCLLASECLSHLLSNLPPLLCPSSRGKGELPLVPGLGPSPPSPNRPILPPDPPHEWSTGIDPPLALPAPQFLPRGGTWTQLQECLGASLDQDHGEQLCTGTGGDIKNSSGSLYLCSAARVSQGRHWSCLGGKCSLLGVRALLQTHRAAPKIL